MSERVERGQEKRRGEERRGPDWLSQGRAGAAASKLRQRNASRRPAGQRNAGAALISTPAPKRSGEIALAVETVHSRTSQTRYACTLDMVRSEQGFGHNNKGVRGPKTPGEKVP